MPDQAPLISIPQAPAPAHGDVEWFEGRGGGRLRAALFRPQGAPRGSVVLNPGRTEPIEKYFEVVAELQARGFVVLVHDWRGHGFSGRFLSDPMKGHARGWRWFLSDFGRLLATFEARLPRPWIAMGHSMGGALTVLALIEGEQRFAGAILSAPMLGVRTGGRSAALARRWAWLQSLRGKAGAYVVKRPRDPLDEMFEDNVLTHDRGRWERWRAQMLASSELQLGQATWGWVAFATAVTYRIAQLKGVERLSIPLVVVAAGDELLCLNTAAQAVAKRAPHGRYVEVPGAFHEILMETDARRQVFWTEFDALAASVAPASASPPSRSVAKAEAHR